MNASFAPAAATVAERVLRRLSAAANPTVRLAALGDSITSQVDYGSAANKHAYGYPAWVEALSFGVVRIEGLGFGVAGDTSAQVLARVPTVLRARPGWCVVLAGINDLRTLTPEQTVANLTRIWTRLIADGVRVIAVPIMPAAIHAGRPLDERDRRWIARVNATIRAAPTRLAGLLVADPTDALVDPGDRAGGPIGGVPTAATVATATMVDGLHPGVRGAYAIGRAIWSVMRPWVSGGGLPLDGRGYDAATHPLGSRIGFELHFGSTGGTLAGGAVGVAPPGWLLQQTQGVAGAISGEWSTLTLASGVVRPLYRVRLTGSAGAGAAFRLTRQIYAGFVAGERLLAEAVVRVRDVSPGALSSVELQCADNHGLGRAFGAQTGAGGLALRYPEEPWDGLLRTRPMTVAATSGNAVSLVLSGAIVAGEGASATIACPSAHLGTVPD